jgi:hypothetical protein
MNKSDLRNIIKEEVRKVINTTLNESNLKDMLPAGPGTYKIEFTTSKRDSFDEATVTVTQEQMDLAKKLETSGYNFWRDAAEEANAMFTSGDSVLNVTKIN